MDELQRLQGELSLAIQSDQEVRRFVFDLAEIRLEYIVLSLIGFDRHKLQIAPPSEAGESTGADWSDVTELARSGIDPAWIEGLTNPGSYYLPFTIAKRGDWGLVQDYVSRTFLSDKQGGVILPNLHLKRRRAGILDEELEREVKVVNLLLRRAIESGLTFEQFQEYREHVRIHGASVNEAANVGAAGAVIAIIDALREIDSAAITDVFPGELPASIRRPIEVYDHLRGNPPESQRLTRAILLSNGRAIVFAGDPDIAIVQATPPRVYTSAKDACQSWELVRRRQARDRMSNHLQFAVGEVKTATDKSSLHERFALGGREARSQTRADRFLMMAILPKEVLEGDESNKRRSPGFLNRDVNRFSDVFNLYFAWGYDDARKDHPQHWAQFKRRLADWCGLS